MSTTLARFNLVNGAPTSVTITNIFRVTPAQFYLMYTVSAVNYGDLFTVNNPSDQAVLAAGASAGTHINAILVPGGPTSTVQPEVIETQLVTE